MAIARAVSPKFKAIISSQLKVIPLFCYSVISLFCIPCVTDSHYSKSVQLPYGFYTRHLDSMS